MFKGYLKESMLNTTGQDLDNAIVHFVLESFNTATQTHIYHLLTKSYAEHIAIGEFYEGLDGCIDSIAESAIGLDVQSAVSDYNANLKFAYSKADLKMLITSYRNSVNYLIEKTNHKEIMSINDKLINIQQLIDNLNYKLQLS